MVEEKLSENISVELYGDRIVIHQKKPFFTRVSIPIEEAVRLREVLNKYKLVQ